jgi:hypothetical protein
MPTQLCDYLDADEKLLWQRLPAGSGQQNIVVAVRVGGHVILSAASMFLGLSVPAALALQIAIVAVLLVTMNLPLVVWGLYRWPNIRRGCDAHYFVTDRRIGLIRGSAELHQIPIHPKLQVVLLANAMSFRLGDSHQVSFGGLSKDEIRLLENIVVPLVKKARDRATAP